MHISRCQICGRSSDAAPGSVVNCACGAHFMVPDGIAKPDMPRTPIGNRMATPAKKDDGVSGKVVDGILSGIGGLFKVAVVLVIFFLIVAVVINWQEINKSRSSTSSSSTQQATPSVSAMPSVSATPAAAESKVIRATAEEKQAVREIVHHFMRTEAGRFVQPSQFQGIIYVVVQFSPRARYKEQIQDLLLVFDRGVLGTLDFFKGEIDPDERGREMHARLDLQRENIPKGAEDTYIAVWRAYYKANKSFMETDRKTVDQVAIQYYAD